jgi:3-oxoacyl-[acyl-carrier protein] reductase
VAEALAEAGAAVAINYSRSEEEAEAAAASLRAGGRGEVEVIRADVADGAAVAEMFERLGKAWGGVDIVVNNAGTTRDGFVMLMSDESWDEVMAVNLRGAFLCARRALRPMIRRRWGRIVNVVSPAALLGREGAANYAAAKGGLLSFTRALAREVGRYEITVNAVCPGFIDTRMISGMPAEERALFEKQIALGRFGTAAEVAQAVRFLASPAAAYVTGAMLAVDGGMMMR